MDRNPSISEDNQKMSEHATDGNSITDNDSISKLSSIIKTSKDRKFSVKTTTLNDTQTVDQGLISTNDSLEAKLVNLIDKEKKPTCEIILPIRDSSSHKTDSPEGNINLSEQPNSLMVENDSNFTPSELTTNSQLAPSNINLLTSQNNPTPSSASQVPVVSKKSKDERKRERELKEKEKLLRKTNQEEEDKNKIIAYSTDKRWIKYKYQIGSGSFKNVHLGYDRDTAQRVAWCEYKFQRPGSGGPPEITKDKRQTLIKEIEYLMRLSHPNIVELRHHMQDFLIVEDNKDKPVKGVVIITELMGCSLRSCLQKYHVPQSNGEVNLPYSLFGRWWREILDALEYMHKCNPPLIHRDLKADNCFVYQREGDKYTHVKIGDFGLAAELTNSTNLQTIIGTFGFMAPEIFSEKYDSAVDIYAFGMVMYEVLTNKLPTTMKKPFFYGMANALVYNIPTEIIHMRRDVALIIRACLHPVPDYRPTAEDLKWHPLFNPECSDNESTRKVQILPIAVEPNTITDIHQSSVVVTNVAGSGVTNVERTSTALGGSVGGTVGVVGSTTTNLPTATSITGGNASESEANKKYLKWDRYLQDFVDNLKNGHEPVINMRLKVRDARVLQEMDMTKEEVLEFEFDIYKGEEELDNVIDELKREYATVMEKVFALSRLSNPESSKRQADRVYASIRSQLRFYQRLLLGMRAHEIFLDANLELRTVEGLAKVGQDAMQQFSVYSQKWIEVREKFQNEMIAYKSKGQLVTSTNPPSPVNKGIENTSVHMPNSINNVINAIALQQQQQQNLDSMPQNSVGGCESGPTLSTDFVLPPNVNSMIISQENAPSSNANLHQQITNSILLSRQSIIPGTNHESINPNELLNGQSSQNFVAPSSSSSQQQVAATSSSVAGVASVMPTIDANKQITTNLAATQQIVSLTQQEQAAVAVVSGGASSLTPAAAAASILHQSNITGEITAASTITPSQSHQGLLNNLLPNQPAPPQTSMPNLVQQLQTSASGYPTPQQQQQQQQHIPVPATAAVSSTTANDENVGFGVRGSVIASNVYDTCAGGGGGGSMTAPGSQTQGFHPSMNLMPATQQRMQRTYHPTSMLETQYQQQQQQQQQQQSTVKNFVQSTNPTLVNAPKTNIILPIAMSENPRRSKKMTTVNTINEVNSGSVGNLLIGASGPSVAVGGGGGGISGSASVVNNINTTTTNLLTIQNLPRYNHMIRVSSLECVYEDGSMRLMHASGAVVNAATVLATWKNNIRSPIRATFHVEMQVSGERQSWSVAVWAQLNEIDKPIAIPRMVNLREKPRVEWNLRVTMAMMLEALRQSEAPRLLLNTDYHFHPCAVRIGNIFATRVHLTEPVKRDDTLPFMSSSAPITSTTTTTRSSGGGAVGMKEIINRVVSPISEKETYHNQSVTKCTSHKQSTISTDEHQQQQQFLRRLDSDMSTTDSVYSTTANEYHTPPSHPLVSPPSWPDELFWELREKMANRDHGTFVVTFNRTPIESTEHHRIYDIPPASLFAGIYEQDGQLKHIMKQCRGLPLLIAQDNNPEMSPRFFQAPTQGAAIINPMGVIKQLDTPHIILPINDGMGHTLWVNELPLDCALNDQLPISAKDKFLLIWEQLKKDVKKINQYVLRLIQNSSSGLPNTGPQSPPPPSSCSTNISKPPLASNVMSTSTGMLQSASTSRPTSPFTTVQDNMNQPNNLTSDMINNPPPEQSQMMTHSGLLCDPSAPPPSLQQQQQQMPSNNFNVSSTPMQQQDTGGSISVQAFQQLPSEVKQAFLSGQMLQQINPNSGQHYLHYPMSAIQSQGQNNPLHHSGSLPTAVAAAGGGGGGVGVPTGNYFPTQQMPPVAPPPSAQAIPPHSLQQMVYQDTLHSYLGTTASSAFADKTPPVMASQYVHGSGSVSFTPSSAAAMLQNQVARHSVVSRPGTIDNSKTLTSPLLMEPIGLYSNAMSTNIPPPSSNTVISSTNNNLINQCQPDQQQQQQTSYNKHMEFQSLDLGAAVHPETQDSVGHHVRPSPWKPPLAYEQQQQEQYGSMTPQLMSTNDNEQNHSLQQQQQQQQFNSANVDANMLYRQAISVNQQQQQHQQQQQVSSLSLSNSMMLAENPSVMQSTNATAAAANRSMVNATPAQQQVQNYDDVSQQLLYLMDCLRRQDPQSFNKFNPSSMELQLKIHEMFMQQRSLQQSQPPLQQQQQQQQPPPPLLASQATQQQQLQQQQQQQQQPSVSSQSVGSPTSAFTPVPPIPSNNGPVGPPRMNYQTNENLNQLSGIPTSCGMDMSTMHSQVCNPSNIYLQQSSRSPYPQMGVPPGHLLHHPGVVTLSGLNLAGIPLAQHAAANYQSGSLLGSSSSLHSLNMAQSTQYQQPPPPPPPTATAPHPYMHSTMPTFDNNDLASLGGMLSGVGLSNQTTQLPTNVTSVYQQPPPTQQQQQHLLMDNSNEPNISSTSHHPSSSSSFVPRPP